MAMTLRIDDELESALQTLVAAEGVSRQEVVKRAVLERAQRQGHTLRVAASADALAERWSDVLHRLGTV
jgi:predicted transcriptional regulator